MTQVRTLNCAVTDRYGRIDGAFVAIYGVCANAVRKAEAQNKGEEYKLSNDVSAITYHANYWYSQQAESEGYPSQQIKEEEEVFFDVTDENGSVTTESKIELTDILTVDLTHPDIINILYSNMEPLECDLACVESDIIRRGR